MLAGLYCVPTDTLVIIIIFFIIKVMRIFEARRPNVAIMEAMDDASKSLLFSTEMRLLVVE